MATVLLIIIYIAFIGLGIPDSVFGTLWPAVYSEFDLPITHSNFVTVTCSVFTCFSSLMSARFINRFGTYKVTAVSTALTALALFAAFFTHNFWYLILISIPLGLGGGAIDSGLNGYVALRYNAMQMNFLHCFYGVGVSLSPYLLSLTLNGEGGWRGGYRTVSFVQMGIAATVLLSAPLWKRLGESPLSEESGKKPITLKFKEIFKIKKLPFVWLMFISSCAVEMSCSVWGSTFLVEHKGLPIAEAAKTVTLYFIGLALGRFLSGILSVKLKTAKIMIMGMAVLGISVILLTLPLNNTLCALGLFLAGMGVAPIYPGLMYLTPRIFGEEVSQSIMGTHMAAAYVGILLTPVIFSFIARFIGLYLFPYYIGLMLLILSIGFIKTKIKE